MHLILLKFATFFLVFVKATGMLWPGRCESFDESLMHLVLIRAFWVNSFHLFLWGVSHYSRISHPFCSCCNASISLRYIFFYCCAYFANPFWQFRTLPLVLIIYFPFFSYVIFLCHHCGVNILLIRWFINSSHVYRTANIV